MAARKKDTGRLLSIVLIILVIISIAMAGAATYLLIGRFLDIGMSRAGFSKDDLDPPMNKNRPYALEDPPRFIRGGVPPPSSYTISFPVNATTKKLTALSGVGAILNLSIANTGETDLYVEHLVIDTNYGYDVKADVGRYVSTGSARYLRHLMIPVPDDRISGMEFSISLDVLVGPIIGETVWTRRAQVEFGTNAVDVVPLGRARDLPEVRKNVPGLYDKVVPAVSDEMAPLRSIAVNLTGTGPFTIMDLVDTALFLESNLDYIEDIRPEDEWCSPMTTMDRSGGDCEDWAVLYSGLIGAMGGSSRVLVNDRHAVSSVYIGEDDSILGSIREAFGTDLPLLVHEDELGKWLIVEPQVEPMFGWPPVNVRLVDTPIEGQYVYGYPDLGWEFTDSSVLYIVDIYI